MCWWPLLRKIFGWKRFLQKSGRGDGGGSTPPGDVRKQSTGSSVTAVLRNTPSPKGTEKGFASSHAVELDSLDADDVERRGDVETGVRRQPVLSAEC